MSENAAVVPAGTPVEFRPDAAEDVVPPPRRPNLRGDLDSVLEFLPSFRGALRGYERSRVDSYVTWAERELRAARRSADEMAARFGACSAELERARQELARTDAGRDARQVSERVGRILELAAEEAAELTASGAAEAEEVVAGAREYAGALLRHAREAEEAAAVVNEEAARVRARADELVVAARAEAEELLAAAVAERTRLDTEAAARRAEAEEKARRQREQEAVAAAEAVATAHRQVEELHRQRDSAAAALQQLTERVGEALATLAAQLPAELPNVVAPQSPGRLPAGRPQAS